MPPLYFLTRYEKLHTVTFRSLEIYLNLNIILPSTLGPLKSLLPLRDLRFPRQVDENCSLLGYYAATSGNFLQTFRNNL